MGQEKNRKLEEKRKIIEETLRQVNPEYLLIDIAYCTDVKYANSDEIDILYKVKAIPKSLAILEEEGIIEIPDQLAEEKKKYVYAFSGKRRILKYVENSPEDKEVFDKRNVRLIEILTSKSSEYDKKGNAIFHTKEGNIKIPFTPRELAQLDIDYEDFEWEPESVEKGDVVRIPGGLPHKMAKNAERVLVGIVNDKENIDEDR